MITCNKAFPQSPSFYSKPWRPDPECDREEIWFDDIRRFLYIDFRKSCGTCLRISTWSKGLSLSRWNDVMQAWCSEEWDPGIPIPMENRKALYRDALEMFFREIPVEIRDIVRPFKWRQFILLKLIRECPEMLELLQSNPVLAWLLADAIAEKEIPLSEGHSWVLRKRKEILQFVSGSATESVVKILSKIKIEKCNSEPDNEVGSQSIFKDLKKLITNDQLLNELRIIKAIPLADIPDLNMHPDLMLWLLINCIRSSRTYNALASGDRESVVRNYWQDTARMGEHLGIEDPVSLMNKCGSIDSLSKLHDRWAEKLIKARRSETLRNFRTNHGTKSFPVPLLPGCAGIVPITTIEELFAESEEMHHCAATYAEKIMSGECSIYKVLQPERATLEIAAEGNTPLLRQLKTIHNGEPSESTRMFVINWIAAFNGRTQENGESSIAA